jgi:hypothetical protein
LVRRKVAAKEELCPQFLKPQSQNPSSPSKTPTKTSWIGSSRREKVRRADEQGEQADLAPLRIRISMVDKRDLRGKNLRA